MIRRISKGIVVISWVALGAAGLLAALTLTGTAVAHNDGCHSKHTCPSDHHTYVWFDSSGQGWDCAKPDASERTAADTTLITYAGLPYYCHLAGSAPPPPPTTTLETTTQAGTTTQSTTTIAITTSTTATATTALTTTRTATTRSATTRWWKSCTTVTAKYRHGVGKVGATDRTKGTPVTNFKRSNTLYAIAIQHNRGLDRDHDGIACETH